MKVVVIPKSKRARERTKLHGAIMVLMDDRPKMFRVRSLDQTASWKGTPEHWEGWFDKETEAEFKQIVENIV